MLASKNYYPYMGVELDEVREVHLGKKTRHFRIFTYQAYNAMGLIGTEGNGIVVADEDKKHIVCDELCITGSGWFGCTVQQAEFFRSLVDAEDDVFIATVNNSPRLRSPDWLKGVY